MDKDLRKILQAVADAGFLVKPNRQGHWEVYDQTGHRVTTFAGTPSDWRSRLNSLAPLKRRGFTWPPRR